jgi:anti-sigma B factor antagonist
MAAFPNPALEIKRQGGDITARIDQKVLDESAVQGIRDSLLALAADETDGVLTLNLKAVDYLGSAMLETLINMYRKLKAKGSQLVLSNLQPQVYEVFEVTKLHELFEIHTENQK